MTPLADHAARLRLLKPTVLIAPAQVLRQLAKRKEMQARLPQLTAFSPSK